MRGVCGMRMAGVAQTFSVFVLAPGFTRTCCWASGIVGGIVVLFPQVI